MLSFNFKTDRLDRLKKCTFANQKILNLIVQEHQNLFEFEKLQNGIIALKPLAVKH